MGTSQAKIVACLRQTGSNVLPASLEATRFLGEPDEARPEQVALSAAVARAGRSHLRQGEVSTPRLPGLRAGAEYGDRRCCATGVVPPYASRQADEVSSRLVDGYLAHPAKHRRVIDLDPREIDN